MTNNSTQFEIVDNRGNTLGRWFWFYSRDRAEEKAQMLNAEGIPEFKPYTVKKVTDSSAAPEPEDTMKAIIANDIGWPIEDMPT